MENLGRSAIECHSNIQEFILIYGSCEGESRKSSSPKKSKNRFSSNKIEFCKKSGSSKSNHLPSKDMHKFWTVAWMKKFIAFMNHYVVSRSVIKL